jgi:hypothetical protein
MKLILLILFIALIVIFIVMRSNRVPVRPYIYESDIDPSFKKETINILNRSRWNNMYRIMPTENHQVADMFIRLVRDSDLDKYHKGEYYDDGTPIRFSITTQSKKNRPNIYINANNWLYGVKQSGLPLDKYREYVINHEFGHGLGYDHVECNNRTAPNGVCPVMYQSTRGCNEFKCGYQPGPFDREEVIEGAFRVL